VKDIKDVMGHLLDESAIQGLREVIALREAWQGIVGERLAEKTSPYKLENGKLFVGAESHAWVQELHYRVENIKRQVNVLFGLEIDKIIIKKVNVK
jgi:predicted nucleic acid-binding Zn ribbon protein